MCNKIKKLTPMKAIRTKCLDCSNEQPSEVRRCLVTDCALYPYRFGRNPKREGINGRECVVATETAS